MHLPHFTKGDMVESLNKGHFGTVIIVFHKEGDRPLWEEQNV